MIDVSIVVPVYNAESYLPRFVQSMQQQTLENFEVIFVDDTSTDNGPALLEKVCNKDKRFRLIRHEKNMGAGAARNTGIKAAKGQTLCFADPDDLLPEHSLEVRFDAYKKHNAIVRACHQEVTDTGEIINNEQRPVNFPELCNPAEAASKFGVSPFLCAHWTWLFPTKMVQRLGIFNEEGVRTAEDIIFLIRMFFHISRMVWIDDTVYYWMKRTDSLSTTVYSASHYLDYLLCVDIFYNEAAQHKKLSLADSFCDDYFACYLPHMLIQVAHKKSNAQDVAVVLEAAEQICARHDVFKRCLQRTMAEPLRYPGFFRILLIIENKKQGKNPLQSLFESHKKLSAIYNAAHNIQTTSPVNNGEN